MRVLVLGAGNMVQAIVLGLSQHMELSDWGIYSPSGTKAQELAQKSGATFVDDLQSVGAPEWIFLGCKPQQLEALKLTLDGRFKDALHISLLAAVGEDKQKEVLEIKRLVRAMPNLNVKQSAGVTLLASDSSPKELPEIAKVFSFLGTSLIVEEAQLDELTLLTGSGPAFFYEFALRLTECFSSLDQNGREALARQVLLGAGISCKEGPMPLNQMIQAVTSKAGVTIAVLNKWKQLDFKEILLQGIEAGKARSKEISEELWRE